MQDIIIFIQQHWLLSVALAAIVALLIILEMLKIKRAAAALTPATAVRLINHNNAAVIDIRSREAFLTGHVVGAISTPLSELANHLKKIERFKAQPIIIVCATGAESAQAGTILSAAGFTPHILAGGIRSWREADMPLVKGQ